ncbi:hypothetical protein BY996DRAFT_6599467 [Phakopsora pachyrhizi]|nr:hypothetical protein BY996DRAFT_6599467 [Phakopsora pachyrhizi]
MTKALDIVKHIKFSISLNLLPSTGFRGGVEGLISEEGKKISEALIEESTAEDLTRQSAKWSLEYIGIRKFRISPIEEPSEGLEEEFNSFENFTLPRVVQAGFATSNFSKPIVTWHPVSRNTDMASREGYSVVGE